MPTRLSIDVTAGVMHANVGLRSDLSTITKTRHERSQKRNQSAGQSTHELQVWKKEANMPTSQHQPSPSGGYRLKLCIDMDPISSPFQSELSIAKIKDCYLDETLIFRLGSRGSVFGMVICKTPLSNSAAIFSMSTVSGIIIVRAKLP